MKILVVNGPNLNLLGEREKEIYGEHTYKDLCRKIKAHCKKKNIKVKIVQSNHEGRIIDILHFFRRRVDGVIINPAGLTHTSVSLADALKAINLPVVEVHISDVNAREDFRKISYVSPCAIQTIGGKGFDGYLEAADILSEYILKREHS